MFYTILRVFVWVSWVFEFCYYIFTILWKRTSGKYTMKVWYKVDPYANWCINFSGQFLDREKLVRILLRGVAINCYYYHLPIKYAIYKFVNLFFTKFYNKIAT